MFTGKRDCYCTTPYKQAMRMHSLATREPGALRRGTGRCMRHTGAEGRRRWRRMQLRSATAEFRRSDRRIRKSVLRNTITLRQTGGVGRRRWRRMRLKTTSPQHARSDRRQRKSVLQKTSARRFLLFRLRLLGHTGGAVSNWLWHIRIRARMRRHVGYVVDWVEYFFVLFVYIATSYFRLMLFSFDAIFVACHFRCMVFSFDAISV